MSDAPSPSDPSAPDPTEIASRAAVFATEKLGPAAAALLADPEAMARVVARHEARPDLEDAVLAEVHAAAGEDPTLAGEFITYFLDDLMRLGGARLSPGMHAHVDTVDIVQSVIGDMWSKLADVRYESRGRFLALLSQRLNWKAVGKARKHRTEHEVKEAEAPEVDVPQDVLQSPLSRMASAEEVDRTLMKMLKLSERDQEILTMHMRQESMDSIAAALGISKTAAYKAVERALARFKELR